MKTRIFIVTILAATILVACNSNNSNGGYQTNAPVADTLTNNNPAKTSIAKADTQFMYTAADAGMMEVELGKYAMSNSTDQRVKNYGSMMVTDHTKAADQLKALASSENVTLPDTLTSEHRQMVNKMKRMSGKDFNKHYIDMMVKDHGKVIDAFKNESQHGKDSTIMLFASNTLPVLEKHLDSAQAVQQLISKNQ